MANGGASTAQAIAGGPKAAPPIQSESVQSKRDLTSWWKQFKRSDRKAQEQPGIFGVPLHASIRYANVAISLFNDEGQSYIYGYVPIVVAKCGVFLKEKATDVEGIFRLAGSEKRIKELKIAFDSPDRYGKGLDWTGYTVHDAANILRRYFNQLPEPIIPLEFYERFRDPLKNHQAQAVGHMDAQSPTIGDFDLDASIRIYQALITELPPLNRQLLLYILDLLAVFASKSDLNKMTTPNLAAIFQPGLLSHPQHDMAPQEYRLSQDVLIFLIENQDSFLIGMAGTAADHETVKDVESGASKPPSTPTTPSRSKTVIGRSSSGASSAAEGRWSNLRRNMSTSSKRSDAGPTPVTPSIGTPVTPAGSVHRSNTVPSRRTGSATASPRFPREKHSDPSTPVRSTPSPFVEEPRHDSSLQSTPIATSAPGFPLAPPEVISASSSEATTPLATVGSDTSSAITRDYQTPKKDTTPLLAAPSGSAERSRSAERQLNITPSNATSHGLRNIFKQSPTSDSDSRKPNKLQKKRIPGSSLSSAHSSTHSLDAGISEQPKRSPITPVFPINQQGDSPRTGEQSNYATASNTPIHMTPQRTATDATLKPTISPTHSFNSRNSVTDQSDADMVGDDMPAQANEYPEKQKRKHRSWFSRSQNKLEQPTSPPPQHRGNPYDVMSPKEQAMSRSTIGSSSATGSQPRRSFQEPVSLGTAVTDPSAGTPFSQVPGPPASAATDSSVFSDSEREKKGPMSWIRGKIQDRKDKDAERRTRTPDRKTGFRESKQDLRIPGQGQGDELPVRGKSFEQQRTVSNASVASEGVRGLSTAGAVGDVPPQNIVPSATIGGGNTENTSSQGQPLRDGSGSQPPAVASSMPPPPAPNGTGVTHSQQRVDAVMEGRK